jgi:RHS repeat-associated protein
MYVHADHLGTPQKMTDGNQTLVWDAVYQPFGETHSITGTATNNQRFPGQYADSESGYHYNGHRDYAPSTGRYLQADPIGLTGGLNLYPYVEGNPLTKTDRFGLIPPKDIPGFGSGPFGPSCGSGAAAFFIPDGLFKDACENHDACYDTCGAGKEACDLNFLSDMVSSCAGLVNCSIFGAGTYYLAVTFRGRDLYDRAQEESCPGC